VEGTSRQGGFGLRQVAALGVAVAVAAGAAAFTGPPAAAMDKSLRENVMEAVVFILAYDKKARGLTPIGSGSGSVIDPSGVILTNYHVVYDFEKAVPHYLLGVSFSHRPDWMKKPTPTCWADPEKAHVNAKMDLALIKCELDMDKRPIPATKKFPYLKMGVSKGIIPGDDVSIIGYPGIGGETINFTAGKIAGWLGPDGKAGEDWLKTDAIVAGGNSGGAAVDDDGKLIGIPTRIGDVEVRMGATVGQINYLRPVDIASKVKRDAEIARWDPMKDGPAKTPDDAKSSSGSGRTDGRSGASGKSGGDSGRDGDGDDDGDHGRGRGTDPGPRKADAGGVTIVGQLVAADTGKGIAGGMVLIIIPGVKVKTLTDATMGRVLYTKAISDGKGFWATDKPLERGASYGVIVLAKGYEPIMVDDGVAAGMKGPDRFDVGKVELARD